MMTPRLQMKEPCRFKYNNIHSIDIQSYMNSYGFTAGLSTAWRDYILEMFENFDASIAANEGIEATVRELSPSRRRLSVSKQKHNGYMIECNEGGGRLWLTSHEDDSLILSITTDSDFESAIDLGCYDSLEAAGFIAQAFRAYRELYRGFRKVFINS